MPLSPLSRYAVLMRQYERRMLRAAIEEVGGDLGDAAKLLGIHRLYLRGRCTYLGGVVDDVPHEPPLSEAKTVTQSVKKREERAVARAARVAKVPIVAALAPPPGPEPVCCARFHYVDGTHDPQCEHYVAPPAAEPEPEKETEVAHA